MQSLDCLKYIFWLPLLLWVPLYFWFLRCSYPIFLKKMVKKGKKWAYVPESVSKNYSKVQKLKFFNVFFTLISSFLSSVTVCWVLFKLELCPPEYGFVAIVPFIIFSMILYKISISKIATMFQSAYFYEYRKERYATEVKGNFQREVDVHYRTVWSFTKKLRNAESHGKLWKYVNAMAKTTKIAPDIYAETMYAGK